MSMPEQNLEPKQLSYQQERYFEEYPNANLEDFRKYVELMKENIEKESNDE